MGLFDYFSSSSSSSSSSASPPATSAAPSATPRAPDTSNKHVTALNPTGIKPCCACPETKIKRDDCFLEYGHDGLQPGTESEGEGWKCRELVEEHKRCMKKLGFNI